MNKYIKLLEGQSLYNHEIFPAVVVPKHDGISLAVSAPRDDGSICGEMGNIDHHFSLLPGNSETA